MTAIQREPRGEVWTTRRLLAWTTDRFVAREVDAPRVVAELLLAHALGCDRMRLYMEADRPATTDELTALRVLVQQASDHVPVQFLVGRASFFGHEFLVDRSTMIPQPCTETLVAAVIEFLQAGNGGRGGEPARVADVGTGSGCIAISVARSEQNVRVVGTDVVPEALDLARRNAAALGVAGRVEFEEGSLLAPLRPFADERPFDVICANLPYIPDDEWESGQVQRAVREHVPARALRGGAGGSRPHRSPHRGSGGPAPRGRIARPRDRPRPAGRGAASGRSHTRPRARPGRPGHRRPLPRPPRRARVEPRGPPSRHLRPPAGPRTASVR